MKTENKEYLDGRTLEQAELEVKLSIQGTIRDK